MSLTLAFPQSPDWSREALVPVNSDSLNIFWSEWNDLERETLYLKIRHTIELCTDGGEDIVISFLPNLGLELLPLANLMGCRCFIAEPNLQKCQGLLSSIPSVDDQNQT